MTWEIGTQWSFKVISRASSFRREKSLGYRYTQIWFSISTLPLISYVHLDVLLYCSEPQFAFGLWWAESSPNEPMLSIY